jgi:Tfp pilus assembly protein PilF
VNPALMIDAGVELHRAGRLAEAERQYRQVLAADPQNADALHLLGILNSQLGREEIAADLIKRAIARDPGRAIYHGNLGLTLHRLGRLGESLASFEKAISLGSSDPNVLNNFGDALRASGNVQRAISILHQALGIDPKLADAHNNLGMTLAQMGRTDEAIAEYQSAINLSPRLAQVHNNLGNALLTKRQTDRAILAFEEALAIRPDYPDAMMNLAVALKVTHEDYRARKLLERALDLRPDFFEALLNYGQSLCDEHQFKQAIEIFRKAVALRPQDPSAHFHLSGVLLLTGDFSQGWLEYEWRTKRHDEQCRKLDASRAHWSGEDPAGKRILIHAEQGAGDTIQFSRLVTALAQRGAEVILACPPQLLRLLRTLDGVSQLITNTQQWREFDFQCYLLSLPLLLNLKLDTIPTRVPYLRAQADSIEFWRNRLSPLGPVKKIGLAWAGNPDHTNDHNRSIPLAKFAPLAQAPGVHFICLQKGNGSEQPPPAGLKLINHTSEIFDYADTAGLIANLDLVIAADTSVAHLAGALGKPVWTLLPFNPDLRWMLQRTDSPWYPTMRLFRQPHLADWDSPISAVTQKLMSPNPGI